MKNWFRPRISITSRNIDSWMLGILISPAAVAIYNPALWISNVFEIPSSTMASVLLPKLAKKIGSEGTRSLRIYYERSLTYIPIFMIPIVVFVLIFSEEIIHILVGSRFEQSADLLRITIFFGFLIPFNKQFNVVMESAGKPKTSFVVMIVTLKISLLSHYIFIGLFDIAWAAFGALFTYLCNNFLIDLIVFKLSLWNMISGDLRRCNTYNFESAWKN